MNNIPPLSPRRLSCWVIRAIGLSLFAACSDPFSVNTNPIEVSQEEICAASPEWLSPSGAPTPRPEVFLPLPHPSSECPFYRNGWQNFLVALQPDGTGRPALLSYPTIDTVFQHTKVHPSNRAFLGDIKQAGGRQILIDQNGNSIYYGIHVNDAFAAFIAQNHLDTAAGLKAYPSDPVLSRLTFPAGVVEFKSAWQIVEGDAQAIAEQTANFISMQTTVPTLAQDPVTHRITENRDLPRPVTVRLLAIHVVATVAGHPEFIWASFEHSTGMANGLPDTASTDLQRDVAPIVPDDKNPSDADKTNQFNTIEVDIKDSLLYKAHTKANVGNKPIDESLLHLDPTAQKFMNPDGTPQQTSIYRMFPASKSNTTHPDDAVTSLNHNVEALFAMRKGTLGAQDKRGHYRLLGAQWMDKPQFFKRDSPFQNDATSPFLQDHLENGQSVTGGACPANGALVGGLKCIKAVPFELVKKDIVDNGSDAKLSILAGEDRLSSTALESFTQAPGDFNNCFTCHNTQAITANGIPLNRDSSTSPIKLLDPGLLNVSHVLSQFLLEEYQDAQTP